VQNNLTFPILSDPNGTISETFGLRFDLPDYLIELYKSLKIDLPVFLCDVAAFHVARQRRARRGDRAALDSHRSV
jgi:hypothetical protein